MFNSWFRKKRQANRKADVVWFNQLRKFHGLGQALKQKQSQGSVVVIAHFPESLERIAETLQNLAIPYEVFSTPQDRLAVKSQLLKPRLGEVALVLAEILPEPFLNDPYEIDRRITIYFVAIEHYPIESKDKRLEELANSIPFPTELEFHVAFDETILKLFGDDYTLKLLTKCHVSEDMPLESNYLTRSLESARVKLSKHITTDIPTQFLAEWYRINLPDNYKN